MPGEDLYPESAGQRENPADSGDAGAAGKDGGGGGALSGGESRRVAVGMERCRAGDAMDGV